MNGLAKRLERIERDLAPATGESLELQISCVKPAENGRPRMQTKGYTLAQLAELPSGFEYEWLPYDGKGAA